jgi:hypothetical protein
VLSIAKRCSRWAARAWAWATSTARRHLEEALEQARSSGDKRCRWRSAMNALAQLSRVEGQLDTAESLFQAMLASMREIGDKENIAIGLLNRAMVAISRNRSRSARDLLLEVSGNDEISSRAVGQSILEASCGLAVLREEWPRAARLFGAAEAQSALTGLHRDPADEAFLAPRVAGARKKTKAAAFAAAEAEGRALDYEAAITETRAWLGTPG